MTVGAMAVSPSVSSQYYGLGRLFAGLRAWLGQFATAGRSDRDSTEFVTVGSVVRFLDYEDYREMTLTVAPASWSGSTPGLVSADSPLGAALMGGRAGEMRQWDSPSGPRRLRIVDSDGHMLVSAAEPEDELRVVPRRTPKRSTELSRHTIVPQPVALPIPAAA